ncbi:branched-chain amino acid ABC transporter permease [Mesorhizobium qingshengii]|uniref:Branched-chain amino acid transport system permease protein n=1 Tax=Mesorhizobium qingshengii TaxID=1165689 RepID=A0A1G5ZAE0_9HYPH|nr:branched-chain amino acid ABC transporter permease [Mesorhizobium qingshengii]SDA91390.1 branched-chain amino acid transport system permease protein [Mesorhizobium qingshengii]
MLHMWEMPEPRQLAERNNTIPVILQAMARPMLAGLACGLAGLYAAFVGILVLMHGRVIIVDVLTLGQCVLLLLGLAAGAKSRTATATRAILPDLARGAVAGSVYGAALACGLALFQIAFLRTVLVSLSPELRRMLSFGLESGPAMVTLVVAGGALGVAGSLWSRLGGEQRRATLTAATAVIVAGTLQQLLQTVLQRFSFTKAIGDLLFSWAGLKWQGALLVGAVAAVVGSLWPIAKREFGARQPTLHALLSDNRSAFQLALLLLGLSVLPALAGPYIGQVLLMVALYTLMGMGLNIEVGLAGLLDLGFVAFFAVGAYATALLTADSSVALSAYTSIPALSFWLAVPIAVALSVIVGVLFGLPVLGVRGDYLAVATLGLGEIVRVIVLSDFAAPILNGAQGILQVPRPFVGSVELSSPVSLFYLTLVCSMFAAFVAWRLQASRLGRAWMALRDDEEVAQALGVNLVKAKLLAYGLGAAFAGLAGAIFATMLTSVYPNSFNLLLSINVLALIVIGGIGSIEGVIVGAILLVGLPELLREFGEYRFLFYGAALIAIMIMRPRGLWSTSRPSGAMPGGLR